MSNAWRLLGNPHLHAQRLALYAAVAQQWLTGLPQLLIVVDWSSLTADMQWHWLRASVVVQGRSLTLYEEVHPRCHLASLAVHQRFIERLDLLLPPSALPPIVLTDAGFRNPISLIRGETSVPNLSAGIDFFLSH